MRYQAWPEVTGISSDYPPPHTSTACIPTGARYDAWRLIANNPPHSGRYHFQRPETESSDPARATAAHLVARRRHVCVDRITFTRPIRTAFHHFCAAYRDGEGNHEYGWPHRWLVKCISHDYCIVEWCRVLGYGTEGLEPRACLRISRASEGFWIRLKWCAHHSFFFVTRRTGRVDVLAFYS